MSAMLLIVCAIIIVALIIIMGLYQKSTNAICKSKKRLDGKTVIVTGGTSGMGLRIAVDLADRGARVIIACSTKNEKEALKIIKEETESDNVVFELLDLSSIESVRKFAAKINKREERLDILVNNAGVGAVSDFITDDGMSFIMQVNYFGTVLLTLLLLPLLKKSGTLSEPARIVNTSSVLHNIGTINFAKLNDIKHYYYSFLLYSNSKLCLVVFSNELVKKLKGSNVVVNCVDPGLVGTRIFYCVGTISGCIFSTLLFILFKTPWEGAQTALHVALDKKAGNVTGGFFKNCKPTRAKQSAYNEETGAKLWEESMRLLKLSEEEVEQCFKY